MAFGNPKMHLKVFTNVANSLSGEECFLADVVDHYNPYEYDEDCIEACICDDSEQDVPFEFTNECLQAFDSLKEKSVQALILQSSDWSTPFEIMCDASDNTIGAVLGQRVDKKQVMIYYVSKSLSESQLNYTTTEKEFLMVVYALDKFRSYILGSKIVVYSDHSAVRYLMEKKDAKPCVDDPKEINERFPDEQLLVVSTAPWYAHYVNYLDTGAIPEYWSKKRKQQFAAQVKQYIWDEPDLFKIGADQVVRRCVPENEVQEILKHAHSSACGGYFNGSKTGYKGCHLPVELAHRALWEIKNVNLDYKEAGELRKLKLNELEEIRDEAKLKSKWMGPYVITRDGKFGDVDIEDMQSQAKQVVHGHRLIPYLEGKDVNMLNNDKVTETYGPAANHYIFIGVLGGNLEGSKGRAAVT
ncbi:uncharacterized protein LOC143544314 [Bidens hawaiensis]|uniref:uncharacterized protein LOC143544314 n=1 Tax=Bidens hawaiensis TaxID=980011 RepID=UPI004049F975